jgi:signal peptide peptidase SppA
MRFNLFFWRRKRIGVIELHGLLAPGPGIGTLNLASHAEIIDRAFKEAGGKPVILDIDSPGGSPVQSELIASRIRRRAEEDKVEVHAVIQDVGASGGYWLACAADVIHANPMSIVGSIGVRGGGFGFTELIARIGVERRTYTAGTNKARLDPFAPERPEDVAFMKALLDDLHTRFKDWVRSRRAGKLTVPEDTVFDGSFMLGARALECGLIDKFNDVDSLVRELGGKRAKPHVFQPRKRGLLSRLPRIAVDAVLDAVEHRRARLDLLGI